MKLRAIKNEIFRSQENMAAGLNLSKSKISKVMAGEQDLPSIAVGILVNQYKVDAGWLFAADDDYTIKYTTEKVSKKDYDKVVQEKDKAVQEKSILQEMLIQYQAKEIKQLKNS